MKIDWRKSHPGQAKVFDEATLEELFVDEKVFRIDTKTGEYEAYVLDEHGFVKINDAGDDVETYTGCTGGPILVVFEDGKVPQADTRGQ